MKLLELWKEEEIWIEVFWVEVRADNWGAGLRDRAAVLITERSWPCLKLAARSVGAVGLCDSLSQVSLRNFA